MTEQTPAEQAQYEAQNLQSSLANLQNGVRMSTLRDQVEDLQSTVNDMDRRVASLRARGYAFEKNLEGQALDFAAEWLKIAPNVQQLIERESRALENTLRVLEPKIVNVLGRAAGNPVAMRSQIAGLKREADALQSRVNAAERSVRGSYDQFSGIVYDVDQHLVNLEWMLDELSEASFELMATESGIMAVKAVWAKNGKEKKDDPEGVLYLTDQRLIFEQKEKVATKKILFITTEKKLVQEKLWEIPVASVDEVNDSKEGFLNKDDFINLKLGGGAPYASLAIHIWEEGEIWKSLIQRARAKEFDADRAIAIDEETAQKVKDAPTECPSCGGAITQVVMRGMDTMDCEYCGAVIRI